MKEAAKGMTASRVELRERILPISSLETSFDSFDLIEISENPDKELIGTEM